MGLLSEKRKNRKEQFTGLKALAAGSLAFARAHAVLDKTEKRLELEIEKENREPPKSCIGRSRFMGQNLMHTKQVLLCIVVFNIVDCMLVLGELILDIYYLKGVLDKEEMAAMMFVSDMKMAYPNELYDLYDTDLNTLHSRILTSHVDFRNIHNVDLPRTNLKSFSDIVKVNSDVAQTAVKNLSVHKIEKRHAYFLRQNNTVVYDIGDNSIENNRTGDTEHDDQSPPIEVDLAHIFHYCSISILAILVVENLLKFLCSGKEYFEKKLEVFDGFIVVASFIVDLIFIKGLSAYKIQMFVVILAFLVPWRVIRVVNTNTVLTSFQEDHKEAFKNNIVLLKQFICGLVVAVIDHEHFRMKLLYKQKKQVATDLKSTKSDNKILQNCINALRKRGIDAGIPEKELNEIIESFQTSKKKGLKRKKTSSTSSYPNTFNLTSFSFTRQSSKQDSIEEVVYVDIDNNIK